MLAIAICTCSGSASAQLTEHSFCLRMRRFQFPQLGVLMFDKPMLDAFFTELKNKYGGASDWDDLIREAHLGIAKLEAGVSIKDLDKRVVDLIELHKG